MSKDFGRLHKTDGKTIEELTKGRRGRYNEKTAVLRRFFAQCGGKQKKKDEFVMKRRMATALLLDRKRCLTACGDSPEKVAQQYPEIIGTWGSILQSEEPYFTLRADGTCTYDQQEGTWKRDGKQSNDELHIITLTLKDGTKVNVELSYQSFENVGKMWNAILIDQYDELPIVNRDLYQRPQKIVDAVSGSWYSEGEEEPALTLNADGSCVVRGQSGVWCETFEAWDTTREDLYRILAQMEDGKYITFLISTKINIMDGNQVSQLYFQNQGQIDSLEGRLPAGTFNQFVIRAVRGEKVEWIEITAENIFDYFEQAEISWWEKDAFGDYENYQRETILRLKDEYVPRLCAGHSDIAVEATMPIGYYQLQGTLGGDEMTLVRDEGYEVSDSVKQDKMSVSQVGGTNDAWFGSYIVGFMMDREGFESEDTRGTYAETFEITRVAGHLCLTRE